MSDVTIIKEVFRIVKERQLEKYEDDSFKSTLVESIQLNDFLCDTQISSVLFETQAHDVDIVITHIFEALISSKEKQNQLTRSEGNVDLRAELQSAHKGTDSYESATSYQDKQPTEEECGSECEEQGDCYETNWEAEDKFVMNKEKETRDSFLQRYPNCPGVKCPRNLFVSILGPGYINSLYITNEEAFPKNWDQLKREDPLQAWKSLNQTIIPYLNKRWANQGINILGSETAVDCYNVNALKSALVETVSKALNERSSNKPGPIDHGAIGESSLVELKYKMDDISSKLSDWTRLITSDIVKRTQTEVNPRPVIIQPSPSLSLSSYKEVQEVKTTDYKYIEEELW